MFRVIKVLTFYNNQRQAFEAAIQLAPNKKYSGVYVFKPDQATTPIKDFYYVVTAYKGDFDVLSERQKTKLWDDSMTWLKAESERPVVIWKKKWSEFYGKVQSRFRRVFQRQ